MARPRVLLAFLSLLVPLAGLAVLEGALRLGGFEYAHVPLGLRYVRSIAGLGHAQSSTRKDFRIDYRPDRELLWRPVRTEGATNSEGFLGPEWPAGRPAVRRRLIALGDSCTVAGDPPYPALLERRLGPEWEVLNAGVGSWSSYQGGKLLPRLLAAHRPDVVTIYFGWNDHWLAWAAPDKELSALLDRQWRLHEAASRSRLLQLGLKLAAAARGREFKPTAATPARVALPDYEANLRSMAAAARAAGSVPILMTAPSTLTPEHPVTVSLAANTKNFFDPSRIQEVHEVYNSAARRVAAETRSPLADLSAEFAKRKDPRPLFTDGIHLSQEGHALAAEILKRQLKTGVRSGI
jgi:lysophospholipase L1-like esterase